MKTIIKTIKIVSLLFDYLTLYRYCVLYMLSFKAINLKKLRLKRVSKKEAFIPCKVLIALLSKKIMKRLKILLKTKVFFVVDAVSVSEYNDENKFHRVLERFIDESNVHDYKVSKQIFFALTEDSSFIRYSEILHRELVLDCVQNINKEVIIAYKINYLFYITIVKDKNQYFLLKLV